MVANSLINVKDDKNPHSHAWYVCMWIHLLCEGKSHSAFCCARGFLTLSYLVLVVGRCLTH